MKERNQLKILLMQIRGDRITRLEELNAFVNYSGLDRGQFDVLDVFETPRFAPALVDEYDALFVGGSSDASVLHPEIYHFVKSSEDMLTYCIEQSKPVFASCYGFQAVVAACRGTIVEDRENMEMGIYEINLNENALDDILLHDTPKTFLAVSGHKERAAGLPAGFVPLASSRLCPYHGFRIEGKPFYGFQFHPEVNRKDLHARITRYQHRYAIHDEHLAEICSTTLDTPESNRLVGKFVDRVILPSLT